LQNPAMIGDGAPVLLDTHYWIWLQLGTANRLTEAVRLAVDQAGAAGALLISAMSVWEVAMLESKGRLELYSPVDAWIRNALATPGLSIAPLTPEIAIESSVLPSPFHGDLVDRIIVATASRMGARLLTRDEKIIEYGRKRHLALL
jgi:PIN domain nuclease of toxin-antitoxin system